jgi:tRNA 5-methylaminomethyl-2-thiouridine biosynthesis bifunctional protein
MQIIVIGAGLAGAATAHALAARGCSVTVLEANGMHTANASPSSGLPAALMAPHHSADDNAISQLSRLGLAATTQAARSLLTQGTDWQPCAALQRAGKLGPQARWYPDAAWVKPAALVAAWLAHPRIALRCGVAVHTLRQVQGAGNTWQAVDAKGLVLAEADAVVLANAYQARTLLPAPPTWLHHVAGQVVYGPWNAQWQTLWPQLLPELAQRSPAHTSSATPCAINGNGHFIPAIPWLAGPIWLSGSTYEHDLPRPTVTAPGIAANLHRLQQLIPAAAGVLAEQHSAGQVQGWAGARCTTRDRLPALGAVSASDAPGLYVCTAMGSRGLSFAAVCGQHVAALITGASDGQLPEHLRSAVAVQRFFDKPTVTAT